MFSFLLLKGFFNSISCHLLLIVFSNIINLVMHIETIVYQQQFKVSLNRLHTHSLTHSLIHTLTHSFTPANAQTVTHSHRHILNSHTHAQTLTHTLAQYYLKCSKSLSLCSKSHAICSKSSRILLKITKS